MITSHTFRGKRYAVLGLARSGLATVEALVASGAEVVAWDSNADARAKLGAGVSLADPLTIDLTGFDGVVVSPGVPINRHPIAEHARGANVPLIGDIELFAQARASLPPHKVIGITGTNGKSTTTALIHHILQTAGIPSLMGGNIGLPILAQNPLPTGGVYVLELSSYQIDLTHSLDCDIAVLLNITPDHLDRYEGFEDYAASKARLFEMQGANSRAIIFSDDTVTQTIAARFSERSFPVTTKVWAKEGASFARGFYNIRDELRNHVYLLGQNVSTQDSWPSLQGPHNAQNVVAAVAVTEVLGKVGRTFTKIHKALRTYPGLPHRMERVRERNGVLYS